MILKSKVLYLDNYKLNISILKLNNVYGFKIDLFENGKIIDSQSTFGITDDINRAEDIYNLLVENKVLPCHLHYIIDDNYCIKEQS